MKRFLSPIGAACLVLMVLSAVRAQEPGLAPFKVGSAVYVPVGESQSGECAVRLSLAPPLGASRLEGFSVLFCADRQGDGYRLDAAKGKWTLASVSRGRAQVLARGEFQAPAASRPLEVRITRRLWLLSVALSGKVVAEVQDYSHGPGLVAVDASQCAPAAEPIVRPLSELNFAESFMRTEDELNLAESKVWRIARGQWKIHSVEENVEIIDVSKLPSERRPQKERSPNPFSVSAFSPDWGLLWAGQWFWSDCQATLSARNRGARAVGIAFNIADESDFFLLRWENATPVLEATPVELVRVQGERRTTLGRAWVNGQEDQWFSIGVRTCGTRIQAILDGALIMDVASDECAGGGVGLYVEGGDEEHQAFFDDVLVRTIGGIDYTSEAWIERHARPAEGSWEAARVEDPGFPPALAPMLKSRSGCLVLGASSWPAPYLRAEVPVPSGSDKVGFLAGLDGPAGRRWRVTLGREGERLSLEIAQEGEGKPRVLAACQDVPVPSSPTVELCADFAREGEINVSVDGRLELHAPCEGPATGAPAVFGVRAKGAQFRKLAVLFRREEDKERPPAEQVFKDDPYMKHWSSPQGAWWPAENRSDAFWHVGDFYGRSDIEVPLRDNVMFIHAAAALGEGGGYVLRQRSLAGEGASRPCQLMLLRLGQEVASATLDRASVPDQKVVLHKDGRYLWVTAGGAEVLWFRDPDPLPGTQAAVCGVDSGELANLTIQRYQVLDDYFESAPADWYAVGRWDVTARFTCDPRWSHMTAVTDSAAILFNKFQYEGDVTVEAFMGMRMRSQGTSYPRIGDLNMALFTRPYDLSSGYAFVLAGWDTYWSERATYLLRGAERVAYCGEQLLPSVRRPGEAVRVIPVPWIGGGRDIHGAWYYVKARKQGDLLSFYVDNHKAYEYRDAGPIDTFSPAIWTYDSSIVVAKVKLSYQRKLVPGRLVPEPASRRPEGLAVAPRVVSLSHPGLREDFESGLAGWQRLAGGDGGEPSVVPHEGGGHCLKVTNPGAGGTFAVAAPVQELGIDIARAPRVRFEYRIPPEAKVNLYVEVAGSKYFVRLTGPDDSGPMLRRLGEARVQADGRWHTAEFDLGAAFRMLVWESALASGQLQKMVVGNLHPGLLAAGIGGNPTGASYWLDNVEVSCAGPSGFTAAVQGVDGEVAETLVAVDRNPDTVPDRAGALAAADLAPGTWYCHVRARLKDSRLTGTAHLPLRVAPSTLKLAAAVPRDGAPWGYGPIRLSFEEDAALGLEPARIALKVNGRAVASAPGLFRMDWSARTLTVDLARTGIEIADGKPCEIELSYPNPDGTPGVLRAGYVAALAQDVTPPGAVEVLGVPVPMGFEEDCGTWRDAGSSLLMRDSSTAAGGRSSLMVQNPSLGGPFMTYAIGESFSAGRIPIIDFDYKVHDAVQVNFALFNPRGLCTVRFTDSGSEGRPLGAIEPVVADDAWHHAEINLLQLIKQLPYSPGIFNQQWLMLADYEFRACAPGASYHVDNFRRVPVLSPAVKPTIEWRAHDAGGIAGYSYVWSAQPDEEPDDVVDTDLGSAALKDLPAPHAYLHVKARDRAGNWGPTSHYRFLVDAAGPQARGPEPAAGTRAASSTVSFTVRDEASAVDPDNLQVEIGGRTYRPDSAGVSYDLASGRWAWDWVAGGPADQESVPDGSAVRVKVEATDFAGNPAAPFAWEWVMDYSQDRQPPTVPVVQCASLPVLYRDDFEGEAVSWTNFRGDAWGASVSRVERDTAAAEHCLRLSAQRSRSFLQAIAYRGAYDLAKYPLLSFEYLIPKSTEFNLQLYVNGNWYELQMTSPNMTQTSIGKLEGIQADEQWHHCTVDLLERMKKALPNAAELKVEQLVFGDAQRRNEANAYWLVDNFTIAGYGEPEARFTWGSRDITGIAGYSVLFGRDAAATPPETVDAREAGGTFTAAEGGAYFFSVRACDHGGNWSAPARFQYFVWPAAEAAEPPAATPGG